MPSTPTPAAAPTTPLRLTTSLAKRAATDLFLLAFFIVAALSVVAFAVSYDLFERRILVQLDQAASMGEDLVTRSLSATRERARLLSYDPLTDLMRQGNAPAGAPERWLLELSEQDDGLKGMAVFDDRLIERAAAGVPVPPLATLPTQTVIVPRTSVQGWEWYDVIVPLRGSGQTVIGALVARESAATMLRPLTASLPAVGESAVLVLAFEDRGDLHVIRTSAAGTGTRTQIGPVAEAVRQRLPVVAGMLGQEGMGQGEDDRGAAVLSAVRSLPELGWGLSVQADSAEVFTEVSELTAILGAAGGLLLVLGVLLSSLLSRGLTKHLQELIGKVGRLVPGQWHIERSIKSGDEIELLDHVLVDVTGRLRGIYDHLESEVERRTHEALEFSALDRAVVDSINYGVITVDNDGRITACNPSAAHLLENTQEAVLGHTIAEAFALMSEGRPVPTNEHLVVQALAHRELTRSRASQRLCLVRTKSDPLPIALTAAPLMVDGQVDGAVAVFEDVTEERQIDAMKSEFIALAGHQLRTPIGALRWHIELLEENGETMSADQRQSLQEMKTLVERTVRLLNTLLQSAKLEEGGIEPSWSEVDLTVLVHDLSTTLNELSAQYKVEQTLQLPASLKVTTDQTLLTIVLHNLLTNAIKYSRHDQGCTLISVHDLGTEVEIRVRDNGIGIPEEDRPRLFEKFFRAKNARVIDTDGNGLGLYISQSILTRLQGRISFETAVDKGTTFTVTLPKQPQPKNKA